MKKFLLLFTIALFSLGCDNNENDTPPTNLPELSETATYKVTFQGTWSSSSHPTEYPSNSHFSGVIGMTHNQDTSFRTVGQLATEGIKIMAETGGKGTLSSEINSIIEDGNASVLISEGGLSTGSSGISFEVTVDKDYPYISLFSMIAPSPDWYVAIENYHLINEGAWVELITLQPMHYDAGTDSGVSFASPNAPTTPQEPISIITSSPLGNGEMVNPSVATFTFEKME
ncbi:elongation factor Ts [Flammeovirga sp. MY04]|uniref:spondin domain-containing protein n=1 Tax=Flammeovirga sp. MY04 TaxID=1191459 RepID=UPI0008061F39|nr:spondin domain-containing protein [Flammeovirga sp. MY04]ANQ50816.1 elongation factor Ts [Flammeovirga sp. MY04]